jgi:hypothetical protein
MLANQPMLGEKTLLPNSTMACVVHSTSEGDHPVSVEQVLVYAAARCEADFDRRLPTIITA